MIGKVLAVLSLVQVTNKHTCGHQQTPLMGAEFQRNPRITGAQRGAEPAADVGLDHDLFSLPGPPMIATAIKNGRGFQARCEDHHISIRLINRDVADFTPVSYTHLTLPTTPYV